MNELYERRLRALERKVNILGAAGYNPLAYGGVTANGVSQAITISDTTSHFEITAGWTATKQLNCTYDSAGRIDCTNPGIYLVNWNLALQVNATAQSVVGVVMLEGTAQSDGRDRITSPGTVNLYFNMGGTMYMTIATANTGISLGLRNTTSATNITFQYGNITVMRIA